MSTRATLVLLLACQIAGAGLAIAINPKSPYYAVFARATDLGADLVVGWGVLLMLTGVALYAAFLHHRGHLARRAEPGLPLFVAGCWTALMFILLAVAFAYEAVVDGLPLVTTRLAAHVPAAVASFVVASWGRSPLGGRSDA